jgi:hypothetical protein
VIPSLREIARHFDANTSFVVLAMAGALTAFVLLAQSIARWFDDRDS